MTPFRTAAQTCLACMALALALGAPIAAPSTADAQDRRTPIEHPILDHKVDPKKAAGYEKAVSRVMAMSEGEMLKLVPTKSAILFCGCPNCSGGQQENGMFEWTIERPLELKCKYCGQVYPSEKYPMNSTAAGVNRLGEEVTYKYYLDEKGKRDFWFEACADYHCRSWFVQQCLALAQAYQATRKPEYTRRAALILDRFAQSYPHMAVLSQWPYQRRAVAKPAPPYPNGGGKWGRWASSEIPSSLPEAYDLICASAELDRLSQQEGVDVRKRIEDDFFRATIEYMFTFEKEPVGFHLNNMAPFYTERIITIGRIIGEPEYVHWGYRWVGNILRDGFFYDGMWKEAPSYHYQTIGGVRRVIAALKGYSDPPGYRSPADGLRLESLDLEAQLPVVQKAFNAPALIAYPNGRICPVHDSWARSRTRPAREQTSSTLLPGFGHASLGRGRGADQLQAQLHFSGGYGHQHADGLNFSLFAKGAELLSDIGYTHSKLRRWTVSTIGHNTVAIDRKDQTGRDSDGDLLMFAPDAGGLSVVEARAEAAYKDLAQVYRRELILVPVSETDAYVVDVFRVKGGRTHDWLLHGSADADMTADCSLPLAPKEGTMLEANEPWVEPVGESSSFIPYGLMREVRQGRGKDAFSATFREADGRGVCIHVLAGAADVFLAKSPRIRQGEGDDRKVYDYWMPQLVVRREGDAAPLQSVFVAVHEPFGSEPFITEVRPLALDPAQDFAVALEIRHGDVLDTIISTLDGPPYAERRSPSGIGVRARLAFLREQAGRAVKASLIDGAVLRKGDLSLAQETPRCEGVVESTTRKADGEPEDAFITSSLLPAGDALAGQWMIVTHSNGHTHGYEISRVVRRDGGSAIILRDDHGLRIRDGRTEECCFPRRKMEGPERFVVARCAAFPSAR